MCENALYFSVFYRPVFKLQLDNVISSRFLFRVKMGDICFVIYEFCRGVQ